MLRRGWILLAAPLLIPVALTGSAEAAPPSVTVTKVGGIVLVQDFANHKLALAISGREIFSQAPITVTTPSECSKPFFDGVNFRTTCSSTPLNPINIWSVAAGNQDDTVIALPNVGSIIVVGQNGNDTLVAGSTASGATIEGGDGHDKLTLLASGGGRIARGQAGNDTVTGSPQQGDKLFGGGGADTINAKDGQGDNVDCGEGDGAVDTVTMDFAPIGDGNQHCNKDIRK